MRNNLLSVLVISLAVSCFSLTCTATALSDQLSEAARNWDEKIIAGIPSKLEKEHLPSQVDTENDLLLERHVDFSMLREKNRLWLLIVITVSTPILLAIVLLCLKKVPECSEESLVNAIGLVMVIEGTIFITVAAATTEQLTAPIGILGAIAGYLFGSAKRRTTEKPEPMEPVTE